MNIQDINFAESSIINIVNLVIALHKAWESGLNTNQLNELWNQISNNTVNVVNTFNNEVKKLESEK